MKKVTFLIITTLLCSCQRGSISSKLEAMMGQTVDFSGLNVAENGYYSNAEISLSDTLPTIVVYMDSSICHSCAVGHLHDLDEALGCCSEEERPYNQLVILSSPRKGEQMVLASTRYHTGLSTFLVDKGNVFLANNAYIPQDQRFHTFLLDASGHIIIVGDPRGGDKIRQLYINQIFQNK